MFSWCRHNGSEHNKPERFTATGETSRRSADLHADHRSTTRVDEVMISPLLKSDSYEDKDAWMNEKIKSRRCLILKAQYAPEENKQTTFTPSHIYKQTAIETQTV